VLGQLAPIDGDLEAVESADARIGFHGLEGPLPAA
jgi:hypothetical protein